MNVNKGFWFGIGCIFLLAACEAPCNSPAVGNPKTEIRPISGFNSVESQGSIDVEILTGTQQEVIVQADEAIIPLIYTEVTGDNKLIISTANNINFCDENIKVIVVTNSYAIREIILSGSDRFPVQRCWTVPTIVFCFPEAVCYFLSLKRMCLMYSLMGPEK